MPLYLALYMPLYLALYMPLCLLLYLALYMPLYSSPYLAPCLLVDHYYACLVLVYRAYNSPVAGCEIGRAHV